MGDIICNDHPLRLLQINSLICHQNPIKDHNNGAISIMGMIEIIRDMIACITGMIDGPISMIEDIVTMTEDITSMKELLGGRCTMMPTEEDFLFRQDHLVHPTILKHHQPQCAMDDHQIRHQVLAPGGLWSLQFLM